MVSRWCELYPASQVADWCWLHFILSYLKLYFHVVASVVCIEEKALHVCIPKPHTLAGFDLGSVRFFHCNFGGLKLWHCNED